MTYMRKTYKLPSRIRTLSWLGQTVQITKESEPEILAELGATQTAVVALCPEGTFDKGRFSDPRMISIFEESVVAILEDPNLPASFTAAANLPWHSEASSYQRISAVLHADGRLVPLKVVKGKYHPMQNAELLNDAKYLEGLSGGATEIVSGITSRNKAVFAVNLLYEDAVVSISGNKRKFGQAATLYTSHDSSLAYAIAFSVAPEGSDYPTHWLAIKHKNTKGMADFRDKLKFDLVNLENKASQCVKEIELLGSIPLGGGTDDVERLAKFVAEATKPRKDKAYWVTWASSRLIKAYEATAQIYGHNALSFYLAANEWVLSGKAKKKNFIAVLDLSENAFKVQSQLKQFLFSMYTGK